VVSCREGQPARERRRPPPYGEKFLREESQQAAPEEAGQYRYAAAVSDRAGSSARHARSPACRRRPPGEMLRALAHARLPTTLKFSERPRKRKRRAK